MFKGETGLEQVRKILARYEPALFEEDRARRADCSGIHEQGNYDPRRTILSEEWGRITEEDPISSAKRR
jgi:hypothetical protein